MKELIPCLDFLYKWRQDKNNSSGFVELCHINTKRSSLFADPKMYYYVLRENVWSKTYFNGCPDNCPSIKPLIWNKETALSSPWAYISKTCKISAPLAWSPFDMVKKFDIYIMTDIICMFNGIKCWPIHTGTKCKALLEAVEQRVFFPPITLFIITVTSTIIKLLQWTFLSGMRIDTRCLHLFKCLINCAPTWSPCFLSSNAN